MYTLDAYLMKMSPTYIVFVEIYTHLRDIIKMNRKIQKDLNLLKRNVILKEVLLGSLSIQALESPLQGGVGNSKIHYPKDNGIIGATSEFRRSYIEIERLSVFLMFISIALYFRMLDLSSSFMGN